MTSKISITVRYFAIFREERGLSEEALETSAQTVEELYAELKLANGFRLEPKWVRLAVNGAYVPATRHLAPGDEVVLIPPVAGG